MIPRTEMECIKLCEDEMHRLLDERRDEVDKFLAVCDPTKLGPEMNTVAAYISFAMARHCALRGLELKLENGDRL